MEVVAPSGQKAPSGQMAQLVEPVSLWKEPGAHSSQAVCPSVALNVPGAHGCGVVAPTEHSDPAGHRWQLQASNACDRARDG